MISESPASKLLIRSLSSERTAGTASAVFSAVEMIISAAKKLVGKAEMIVSALDKPVSVVETIVSTTEIIAPRP